MLASNFPKLKTSGNLSPSGANPNLFTYRLVLGLIFDSEVLSLRMSKLSFGPLRTRETPQQDRAIRRVHLILQTTANALAEVPADDLNTGLIAERASIPVSSIYRYFPTLDDLLFELYRQTSGQLRQKLYDRLSDEATHPTWRSRLAAALRIHREYVADHPFYRPLLIRFLTKRAPNGCLDSAEDELVAFFRERWSAGADGFKGADADIVANTTVQIALSLEHFIVVQRDKDTSRPYSSELARVLDAYLSIYLSD